jgi:MFS family permease
MLFPMTTQRILRTYYSVAWLYTLSASLIWGVNTLFLLDAGLDIFEVFVANGCFTAGMVLFEIPTGVVADTKGRRVSFLSSLAVLAVTTLAYLALAQVEAGVAAFAIVSVFMGLGFTFYSGAVEAWLVDALAETGYDGELDSVFARSEMVTGAAMLCGTVGGGFLGQIDLAIPYLVRVILLVGTFGFAYFHMFDVGFAPRPVGDDGYLTAMATEGRAGVRFGWKRRALRLLMIAGAIQAIFLNFAFHAWQPYFLELLDANVVWVAGVVSALFSVSGMAGNAVAELFTRFCGKRTTVLIISTAAISLSGIGMGLAGSFWIALPLFLAITFALGAATPVRRSYMHQDIPSDHRATVISFDGMVSGIGGVTGQFGLGAVAQNRSLAAGYTIGGLVTGLALPFLAAARRIGEPADQIAGGGLELDTCPIAAAERVETVPRPEPVA